jgi:hypothetical protein
MIIEINIDNKKSKNNIINLLSNLDKIELTGIFKHKQKPNNTNG